MFTYFLLLRRVRLVADRGPEDERLPTTMALKKTICQEPTCSGGLAGVFLFEKVFFLSLPSHLPVETFVGLPRINHVWWDMVAAESIT